MPVIDDRDRHLSRLGILAQPPVACDTERLARTRLNRDHRLLVRAVELSEVHEHGSGQPVQVYEEAPVTRLFGQPAEDVDQSGLSADAIGRTVIEAPSRTVTARELAD